MNNGGCKGSYRAVAASGDDRVGVAFDCPADAVGQFGVGVRVNCHLQPLFGKHRLESVRRHPQRLHGAGIDVENKMEAALRHYLCPIDETRSINAWVSERFAGWKLSFQRIVMPGLKRQ